MESFDTEAVPSKASTPSSPNHQRRREEEKSRLHKQCDFFGSIMLDIFIAMLGGIGIAVYAKAGKHILNHVGFHCGDQSLMKPYKSSTISSTINGVVGILVPAFIIVANTVYSRRSDLRRKIVVGGFSVNQVLCEVYILLGPFVAGAGFQHIFTDIGKYAVGRLRPHFFDICKPSFVVGGELHNCSTSELPPTQYIEAYTCTNTLVTKNRLKEAHVSFPSGHSSFIFYCMTYAFIYIQFCLPKKTGFGFLPRVLIQTSCLWWAWHVALSRIVDNKHHPTDVFSGAVVGVVVALLFAFFVARLHDRDVFKPSPDPSPDPGRHLKTTKAAREDVKNNVQIEIDI